MVTRVGGIGLPAEVEFPSRTDPRRGRVPRHPGDLYSALYHSLLHPNVVSDDNGSYAGSDGQVHRSPTRAAYANFSEWDIYRSEMQLVALLAPHQAGDMIQSLVNDAQQDGWLPKWAIVGGDASQMNGDSADPIIADAYAFGVRGFDAKAALAAMVKGATEAESPPRTGDRTAVPQSVPEPALCRCRLPRSRFDRLLRWRIGHPRVRHRRLLDRPVGPGSGPAGCVPDDDARAQNWEYLFNPATGYIAGANATTGASPGAGLPDLDVRGRGPGRIRGGQRHPVHLVRPAGSRRSGQPHGRRRQRRGQTQHLLHPPECRPLQPLRLGRKRTEPVDPLGVRLLRGARGGPSRSCDGSPTRSIPTSRRTSRETTTSVHCPPGTSGPPSACSR